MHYTIFYTLIGWFEIVSALFTRHAAKGYMLPRDMYDFSICVVFYHIAYSLVGNK